MDCNPSISRAVDLPIELWTMVLNNLGRQDRKRLRLTNRAFRDIAAPLCFETITFELSEDSVENLAQIASDEKLARHVRTLVFCRNPGLRRFADLEEWKQSVTLPEDPNVVWYEDEASDNEDDNDDDVLSYEHWLNLSEAERRALHSRYEDDCRAAEEKERLLTSHLCFRRMGCIYSEPVHPARISSFTASESVIEKFDKSLATLTQIKVFEHKPTVLSKGRWVTRWQWLRINPYKNIASVSYDEACEKDDDVEALQLSCVLRAIGWAKRSLNNLGSMIFHVEGPSFWGTHRLRRLWHGDGHGEIRRLRELYDDAVEADAEAGKNLRDDIGADAYARQLVIMENALGELTHLDCSVSEEEENGGLLTAARPLFEFLCCANSGRLPPTRSRAP